MPFDIVFWKIFKALGDNINILANSINCKGRITYKDYDYWVASNWKIQLDIFMALKLVKGSREDCSWTPPPPRWVKINFDKAAKGNPGPVGCRGVIKDENGIFISIVVLPVGCQTNHLAKAIGAYQGLLLAKQLDCNKVWLEGNSNNIINCIKGLYKPS